METYEVEDIVTHREREGQIEYFIKWKEYSSEQNTWEPAGNLVGCKKILRSYHRRRQSQISTSAKSYNKQEGISSNESVQGIPDDDVVAAVEAEGKNVPQSDGQDGTNDFSIKTLASPPTASTFRTQTREERAQKREVESNVVGGVRKRRSNGKKKQLVIPFKLQERENPPEILDATEVKGELCFVVKWPETEQLELVPATEMYVEYPMDAFKFYEKCMGWVHFGSSESNC